MARVTARAGSSPRASGTTRGEMTLLRAFWDAAREVDPQRAAEADEGVVMRWCADGELAGLWSDAGLREVRFGSLIVSASYTELRGSVVSAAGRRRAVRRVLRVARRRRRAALHDAYQRRLGVGEGPFELARAPGRWQAASPAECQSMGRGHRAHRSRTITPRAGHLSAGARGSRRAGHGPQPLDRRK